MLIFKFINREVIGAACYSRKWGWETRTFAGSSLSIHHQNVFKFLSSLLLAWRIEWHVAFLLGLVGLEEARHRSLSSRRLSQQGTSSCLGHLATLARLMFLRGNFFGLSSSHLDSFFNFFDEAQQPGIMFRLPLRVNQLLTVSKLNSLARIIKPAHSCNSL